MSKLSNILVIFVISSISGLLLLTSACKTNAGNIINQPATSKSTTYQVVVPYIPPSYYQCINVLPLDLENAFYSAYGNTYGADAAYDGQVFVFKDLLVDAWMIKDVDKGWLWADLIKCPVDNLPAAKILKPGDKVDIVGICVGRDPSQSGVLLFQDCYVLQPGSVQLPAPGGGSTFTPAY